MSDASATDLLGPMNLLDLEHGTSIVLRIERYQLGTTEIHPREITARHLRTHMQQNDLTAPPPPGTPITIRVPVLRAFGERLDAPSSERYWDITSKTLMADLEPRLLRAGVSPLTVKLTANGYKPTKRYSIETGG